MPRRRSAKLILSTSTNGSAKNNVSQRNGTPITVVRPEGNTVNRRCFSHVSAPLLCDAPSVAEERGAGVLIASPPRR